MNITLRQPKGMKQWLQLYRLYLRSFPRSERKPFKMILNNAKLGKTDLWYLDWDGKFGGLAITINGSDKVLLDYFSVNSAHRGEGIGTAALKTLLERYDAGLFLEIETTHGHAPNQTQREKRKRFYLHAGLQELGVEAKLFGVDMELLGHHCTITYDEYKTFYHDTLGPWAAEHIEPV